MWGADVSSTEGGEQSVPIGTLFFDGQKLKDWCNQTPQTLDKYEKISIVGQGSSFRTLSCSCVHHIPK